VSLFKTRAISSVILLAITLTAIILGQWPYIVFTTMIIAFATYEYTHIFKAHGYTVSYWLVWAINLVWLVDALPNQSSSLLAPGLAALSIITAIWVLWRRQTQTNIGSLAEEWALTLAGGVYLGMGGAYLIRLRTLPDGLGWVLTAFPIIWVGESVAYLVGSRWGQHKMAPLISPGKSWEGFTAEVVSATLTGAGLGALWTTLIGPNSTINGYKGLLLGGILSGLTPTGDFFISLLKREVGVKDSGKLIPGHGGMLDRIDSLLWTGFIAWVVITLIFM